MFRGRRPGKRIVLGAALLLVACAVLILCLRGCRRKRPSKHDPSLVLVTGYCNCSNCCGWTLLDRGGTNVPVYAYGKLKGRPKKIGVTASGTVAAHGTVAADPRLYSFGTRLMIPGYGFGCVEDLGGAIRGRHIDVWFPTHAEAKRWGARWLKVRRCWWMP